MNKADYYLKLLEDYTERCRHIESQRERVQVFIITISSLIMGFIVNMKFSMDALAFAITLIFVGFFGVIILLKYKERFDFQHSRAQALKKLINSEIEASHLDIVFRSADKIHNKKNKMFSKIRLYILWIIINIFISSVGLGSIITIYVKVHW